MIRTLIIDDEPLARSRIRAMLVPHADIDVVAECSSAGETTSLLQTRNQINSLTAPAKPLESTS